MKRTIKLGVVGVLSAVTITGALAATERADAVGEAGDRGGGGVVRGGDAVVRSSDGGAIARGGDARTSSGQSSEQGAEQRNGKGGDATVEDGQVVLSMRGDEGTEFSGTCSVGGEEKDIKGQVPQEFTFELGGGELECEVRNEGEGTLKMVLVSGDDRLVQKVNGDSTLRLAYSGDVSSSSTSSSTNSSSSSSSITQSSSVTQSSSSSTGN